MELSTITVEQKRKRGRPRTGESPILALRIPADMVDRLDAEAERRGVSRSDLVRDLIEWAVDNLEADTPEGERLRIEFVKQYVRQEPSSDG